MTKFQINTCPLCDKVLKLRQANKVNVFSCPNRGQLSHSHYEVECDKNTMTQHMYVDVYKVSTCGQTRKSKVLQKYITSHEDRWVEVGESGTIYPDNEDRVLARIQNVLSIRR